MGFFAAVLAWGQRKTIINKCTELIDRMDGVPYDFVKNHEENDLKRLEGFKHRTFNATDLLYFIRFFHEHYSHYHSLETAFVPPGAQTEFRNEYMDEAVGSDDTALSSPACYLGALRGAGNGLDVATALNHFRTYFFTLPHYPVRTPTHLRSPTPAQHTPELPSPIRN